MRDGRPEIYLAGPEVFLPDPWARAGELKAICASLGAIGWFPLDNQHDVADPDPDLMAQRISRADEALLARCDAVVANLAPFRGPSMDTGTAYEMGLAKGLGKFVVGYSTDPRRYQDKVAALMTLRPTGSGLRDPQGWLCRDFGLIDNLMMVKGAHAICNDFAAAVACVVARFAALACPPVR
jgi:nucleoside 2-deoxyribosyltransferase